MERDKKIDEIWFSGLEKIVTSLVSNSDNSQEKLMSYFIISAELEKDKPNFIKLINTVDDLIINLNIIWVSKDELLIFESLKTYIWNNAFWWGYVKEEVHHIIYL